MMDLNFVLGTYLFALIGTVAGSLISSLPGLHVYNVIGFALLFYIPMAERFPVHPFMMTAFLVGMLVGYGFVFTVPTVYLQAPDDTLVFNLMPGQRYLTEGRGHEAVVLTSLGALLGILALVVLAPLVMPYLKLLSDLLNPHLHWIIGMVILYILLSEFPKDFGRRKKISGRLIEGWSTIAAGYLTFALSSVLGIILFTKTLIEPSRAFQNLMPALVGLFAAPNVILNLISRREVPRQVIQRDFDADHEDLFNGTLSGVLGGGFSAFIPAVTAGIGGLLAGHATAQWGDRSFMISMGASRVVYYVGAVTLFFMPLIHVRRGLLAQNIALFYAPETHAQFYLFLSAIAFSAVVAFFMTILISRFLARRVSARSYRIVSAFTFAAILGIVFGMAGFVGLAIFAVAAMIGIIPVIYFSRRSNALAVILVPIWLNMSGLMDKVVQLLGLR